MGIDFTIPIIFIILCIGFCLGFYVRDIFQIKMDQLVVMEQEEQQKVSYTDKRYSEALKQQMAKRKLRDKKKTYLKLVETTVSDDRPSP